MRSSIEELLKLSDGEPVDAELSQRVADCPESRAVLQRIETVRRELRELKEIDPPEGVWQRVLEEVHRPSRPMPGRRSRYFGWSLLAAAAAAALIAMGLRILNPAPSSPPMVAVTRQFGTPDTRAVSYDGLLAESRRLERVLGVLNERPRVVNGHTVGTIFELQDRIALVDYQLSRAADAGITERQSQRLWQERVDLMNSLVTVEYAQFQNTAF